MAEEPDRLKREIEDTRAELTRDVNRLADKTSPTRVAQRRWTAAKEKVMGSSQQARDATTSTTRSAVDTVQDKASQLGDRASSTAHNVADSVRAAPQAVTAQAQGNPIAAGIIAFGVGMLAATLIPSSEAEKRAGQQLRENAGELTDRVGAPLRETATQLKQDVGESVREAADQVKDTAREAAQATRQQATASAQEVKEQGRQATSSAS